MRKRSLFIVVLFILLVVPDVTRAQSRDVPRMTKEELRAVMGKPEVVIIDVRSGRDWTGSDSKIKGAVREDPEAYQSWVNKYPEDKMLVFYCA